MTDQNDAGGAGTEEETGGTGDNANNDAGGTGGQAGDKGGSDDKKVSFKDHQRALTDLHRFKAKANQADGRIADLEAKVRELTASQEKPDDWKAKYERLEAERQSIATERDNLKTSVVLAERHRAVLPELRKAGFREDADELLELVALDDLEVEVTSAGRFIVHGVESFVESVKKKFPYAFAPKKTSGNYAGGGASGGNGQGEWTPEKINALEDKLKKEKTWHTQEGQAQYATAVRSFRESRRAK